jgi:hypothetical protein
MPTASAACTSIGGFIGASHTVSAIIANGAIR